MDVRFISKERPARFLDWHLSFVVLHAGSILTYLHCIIYLSRYLTQYLILKILPQSMHSPLFMGFWIHKSTNSPVYTFSTLFYAKIMYFYMELLKAIDAILLPLKLLYFFPKKQGFFGNFYEILILKIVFFSTFAVFSWKNQ